MQTIAFPNTLKKLMLLGLFALSATGLSAAVSSYEKQIIASVLVLEAANQGEEGMLAVLHVINNRAEGNPDRAISVVARRKAFSCLNSITSQKHPDYGPALRRAKKDRTWDWALEQVELYVSGRLGEDFTGGATHYCILPPKSWREQMLFTAQIGKHHFFQEI